jgi:hypothetical protein
VSGHDGVTRFLVSGEQTPEMKIQMASSSYANWIEGRPNHHGTTSWLVTVYDTERERFIHAARVVGDLTLQTLDWMDLGYGQKREVYEILMGDKGWHPTKKCPECLAGNHLNCTGKTRCEECDGLVMCPCPEEHP